MSPEAQARAEALIGTSVAGGHRLEKLLDSTLAGASFEASGPAGPVLLKVLYPETLSGETGERINRERGRTSGGSPRRSTPCSAEARPSAISRK